MNRKQVIGIVVALVGVFLIGYAINSMQEVAEAKGTIDKVQHYISRSTTWNSIVEFFGGKAHHKASEYDVPLLIMLISGIVLTVAGAFAAYRFRK